MTNGIRFFHVPKDNEIIKVEFLENDLLKRDQVNVFDYTFDMYCTITFLSPEKINIYLL
jgi:hypothetical protein